MPPASTLHRYMDVRFPPASVLQDEASNSLVPHDQLLADHTQAIATTTRSTTHNTNDERRRHKSRDGCTTCRKKRLKCDETKPSCLQCEKRNVLCAGYQKAYKWKTFEETRARGDTITRRRGSRTVREVMDYEHQHVTALHNDSTDRARHQKYHKWRAFGQTKAKANLNRPQSDSRVDSIAMPHEIERAGNIVHNSTDQQDQPQPWRCLSTEIVNTQQTPQNSWNSEQSILKELQELSPHFMEDFNFTIAAEEFPRPSRKHFDPFASVELDARTGQRSTNSDKSRPHFPEPRPNFQQALPRIPGLAKDKAAHPDSMAISALLSKPTVDSLDAARWYPLGTSTPSRTPSCCSVSQDIVLRTPDVGSPTKLLLHFDQHTCSILSVKDGPGENPWRTLIGPLAHESEALYHAILAMAAFHGAHEDSFLHTPGMAQMTKSIRRLASEIDDMRLEHALATSLALAFCEGWDSAVTTGVSHLRAANVMVKNLLDKHRQDIQSAQLCNKTASRIRFLCNTFVYMDVVARLTCFQDASEINFANVLATANRQFEDHPEIDPLMGCAMTLFPLIARVASLVQRAYRSPSNSLNLVSSAMELKEEIEKWQVYNIAAYERPEDPKSDIQHFIQTAEAYRCATLLYLHQAIHEIPSRSAHTLAREVLVKIASVPLSSGALIVQIFPLFAASCEITDLDDRIWITQRWAAMIARLKLGNIKSCWDVVQEVWSRRDAFEDERVHRQSRRGEMRGYRSSSATEKVPGTKDRAHMHWTRTTSIHDSSSNFMSSGICSKRKTSILSPHPERKNSHERINDTIASEHLEYEYTIRGELHWLRVMADWRWEGTFTYDII